MTDLHTTILQKASGESRLNPDEQRQYMGTYRERVVLVITFDELAKEAITNQFENICQKLVNSYSPLYLKLSPLLSDKQQISLMKVAQTIGIATAIIDEKVANCPYALVFHTDHAVDQEEISLEATFPNLISKLEEKKEDAKPSFWKKLFG
ncbi:TPA: YueI family protein [Streptococcus suis]|nr:YueI family protein [Streptococcus suis]